MGPIDPVVVELVGALGGGGIVWLILREVFRFVRERKTGSNGDFDKAFYHLKKKVDDLHDWHNHKDGDGVFVWYVRRSLEDSVNRLAGAIQSQTEFFKTIAHNQSEIRRELKEIKDRGSAK